MLVRTLVKGEHLEEQKLVGQVQPGEQGLVEQVQLEEQELEQVQPGEREVVLMQLRAYVGPLVVVVGHDRHLCMQAYDNRGCLGKGWLLREAQPTKWTGNLSVLTLFEKWEAQRSYSWSTGKQEALVKTKIGESRYNGI